MEKDCAEAKGPGANDLSQYSVKALKEPAYTQSEADAAAGIGAHYYDKDEAQKEMEIDS